MWKYFSFRIHLYNCTIPITLSTYLYLYLHIPLSRGNSLLSCWASLTNTLFLCIRYIRILSTWTPLLLLGPDKTVGNPSYSAVPGALPRSLTLNVFGQQLQILSWSKQQAKSGVVTQRQRKHTLRS